MKADAIVEEVHRVRERMWDEAGGDLGRLIESFRAGERENAERVVTPQQVKAMRRQDHEPASRSAAQKAAD